MAYVENTLETNDMITGKESEINKIILKWARYVHQAPLTKGGFVLQLPMLGNTSYKQIRLKSYPYEKKLVSISS